MSIKLEFLDFSNVIVKAKPSIIMELYELFSFFSEGYQFHPKFKYGTWDGKIHMLERSSQECATLPYGLIPHLIKYAKSNNIDVTINKQINTTYDLTYEDFEKWVNKRKYYSGSAEIEPYWYQLTAVYESLVNKRRILNLPTSAGKSLIQALLTKYVIEHSDFNVLILVPTTSLVQQMKDDLVDYRLFKSNEIAEVRSGFKQKNERVVVATWQSAIKKSDEWFQQFGMLLCDEMHLAVGKSISTIIKKMYSCEYKIGLSGSLRDGKSNMMQYVGLFGSIFNPVTTSQLMESDQVSKLKIHSIFLKYPEKVSKVIATVDYASEIKFITKLKKRTDWVCRLANKLTSNDENAFVMFKHIEHGKEIFETLKSMGHKNVYYVSGEIDTETRTELKNIAEHGKGVIIIASYGVFSTGISVKNLHHIIFAHPVKSKIIVLQTIGRVLRKHGSKSIARVWDIVDDMSMIQEKNGIKVRKNVNYALKHAIERIERYAVECFDYEIKEINFLE